MSSYQQSLAQLFKAEEEANKTIRQAEEKKQSIMDEAYSQSKEEIAERRKQMELEFQGKAQKNQNNFDQLVKEATETKKKNDEEFRVNKDKVVDLLMQRIFTVDLELPRNVRGDFHKVFKKQQA